MNRLSDTYLMQAIIDAGACASKKASILGAGCACVHAVCVGMAHAARDQPCLQERSSIRHTRTQTQTRFTSTERGQSTGSMRSNCPYPATATAPPRHEPHPSGHGFRQLLRPGLLLLRPHDGRHGRFCASWPWSLRRRRRLTSTATECA